MNANIRGYNYELCHARNAFKDMPGVSSMRTVQAFIHKR